MRTGSRLPQTNRSTSHLPGRDGWAEFHLPINMKAEMTIGATLLTCNSQSLIYDGPNAYGLSQDVTNM